MEQSWVLMRRHFEAGGGMCHVFHGTVLFESRLQAAKFRSSDVSDRSSVSPAETGTPNQRPSARGSNAWLSCNHSVAMGAQGPSRAVVGLLPCWHRQAPSPTHPCAQRSHHPVTVFQHRSDRRGAVGTRTCAPQYCCTLTAQVWRRRSERSSPGARVSVIVRASCRRGEIRLNGPESQS